MYWGECNDQQEKEILNWQQPCVFLYHTWRMQWDILQLAVHWKVESFLQWTNFLWEKQKKNEFIGQVQCFWNHHIQRIFVDIVQFVPLCFCEIVELLWRLHNRKIISKKNKSRLNGGCISDQNNTHINEQKRKVKNEKTKSFLIQVKQTHKKGQLPSKMRSRVDVPFDDKIQHSHSHFFLLPYSNNDLHNTNYFVHCKSHSKLLTHSSHQLEEIKHCKSIYHYLHP